jgi:hypothetical protein
MNLIDNVKNEELQNIRFVLTDMDHADLLRADAGPPIGSGSATTSGHQGDSVTAPLGWAQIECGHLMGHR